MVWHRCASLRDERKWVRFTKRIVAQFDGMLRESHFWSIKLTEKRWKIQPLVFRALNACVTSASRWNSNWKSTRVTIVVTVCVFDCIFSDIHAHTHTEDVRTKRVKSSVFPYVVLSLYICWYLRGRVDSRAANSHEEQKHICVHVHEFFKACTERQRRCARCKWVITKRSYFSSFPHS